LNFEHSYFLTPQVFEIIIESTGLNIVRHEKFEGHSYFFELQKFEVEQANKRVDVQDTKLFDNLWSELDDFIKETLERIDSKEIPTFLFGSHVFSQALFTQGLHRAKLAGVLDNSRNKQGARLYGTELTTLSPEVIRNLEHVQVILRASHYQEEIRKQLLDINPNVEIIE
jgi:hypothetical protein